MADRVPSASSIMSLVVEGCVEDVDAATAIEEYSTAVEAAAIGLLHLAHCSLILSGLPTMTSEKDILMALAVHRPEALDRIADLPDSYGASRQDAEQVRRMLREELDELRSGMPIQLPLTRRADGFFPSIRVAKEIEKLRAALGMPGLDWLGG
jgi:hypothetical protein